MLLLRSVYSVVIAITIYNIFYRFETSRRSLKTISLKHCDFLKKIGLEIICKMKEDTTYVVLMIIKNVYGIRQLRSCRTTVKNRIVIFYRFYLVSAQKYIEITKKHNFYHIYLMVCVVGNKITD